MSDQAKMSKAFEPFMSESGPNDKREAIVIYRSPQVERPAIRGRLRALKQRLDYVKVRAGQQKAVHASVVQAYQKEGTRRLKKKLELSTSSVGSDVLPVAQVEVTAKTLPALAAHPDVVAILPNQKIHPIQPKEVDYEALSKAESKDGLTWGLKKLGIPKLWEKTKGKHINVAVLDTGVHGDHPGLAGRVEKFLVVDPLGRRIEANPSFDSGQHGTHVCGTIAGGKTDDGVSIGVAPEANLFAAGVLVGDATLRTLIEGMSWAIENGADIINMSLGFTYYEPKFVEIFEILIQQFGVLPVVAVGNENHGKWGIHLTQVAPRRCGLVDPWTPAHCTQNAPWGARRRSAGNPRGCVFGPIKDYARAMAIAGLETWCYRQAFPGAANGQPQYVVVT